jgi:hypothetical protein
VQGRCDAGKYGDAHGPPSASPTDSQCILTVSVGFLHSEDFGSFQSDLWLSNLYLRTASRGSSAGEVAMLFLRRDPDSGADARLWLTNVTIEGADNGAVAQGMQLYAQGAQSAIEMQLTQRQQAAIRPVSCLHVAEVWLRRSQLCSCAMQAALFEGCCEGRSVSSERTHSKTPSSLTAARAHTCSKRSIN